MGPFGLHGYVWQRKGIPLLVFNFFFDFFEFWWLFKSFEKFSEIPWNLRDGFTNVGSGSRRLTISFLANCWQGVNSSRRLITNIGDNLQILLIFSLLLVALREKYQRINFFFYL